MTERQDIISYVTETITTYVTEQVISYVTEQVITYEEVDVVTYVDRTFNTELTDETTVFTREYIGDPITDLPVDEPVDIGEEFTVEIVKRNRFSVTIGFVVDPSRMSCKTKRRVHVTH